MARVRERNRLAAERQELSNDLSKLQKNLRDTARETAANQPGVSQKLRQALTDVDQSDLDNHVPAHRRLAPPRCQPQLERHRRRHR